MRAFRLAFILASSSVSVLQAVPTSSSPQQSPNPPRVRARRSLEEPRSSSAPAYVVVRFRDGATQNILQDLPEAARWVKAHSRSRLHRFSVPQGVSRDEALAAFRSHPLVEEAGPGLIVRALEVPNDENFIYQWHLHSTDGGSWADGAWDRTRPPRDDAGPLFVRKIRKSGHAVLEVVPQTGAIPARGW